MMEFVLVLPILMVILVLTLFIGHSMKRKQDVIAVTRHFAWRHAKKVDGPWVKDAQGNVIHPRTLDHQAIIHEYFQDDPERVDSPAGGHGSPQLCVDLLIQAANAHHAAAGQYANHLINGISQSGDDGAPFPRGQSMRVEASYQLDSLWLDSQNFGRDVADKTYREGFPWQFGDIERGPPYWGIPRDHYISGFDGQIRIPADAGNGLCRATRNLYLRQW